MGEVDPAEGVGALLKTQVVTLSDPRLEEDLSESLTIFVDDGAVQEACSIGERTLPREAAIGVALTTSVHLLIAGDEEVGRGEEVGMDDELVPVSTPLLSRLAEEQRYPSPRLQREGRHRLLGAVDVHLEEARRDDDDGIELHLLRIVGIADGFEAALEAIVTFTLYPERADEEVNEVLAYLLAEHRCGITLVLGSS